MMLRFPQTRRRSLLLALAVSLAAAAGGAAPPAPPAEEPFFDTVDVNLVTLEVFVTDAQGRFVSGLAQDDFQVFEDGRPVEISNFYAAEPPAAEAPAAPGDPAAEAPAAVPEEQRLHLTIFLDNYSLTPGGRNRMIKSVEAFVRDQLHPDDRVLVASYDGPGSLKVRQAATSEPGAVLSALEQAAKEAPGGIGRSMEYRQVVREIDLARVAPSGRGPASRSPGAEASATYSAIRLYAEARHQEVRASLEALGGFVDALSGLPGRKALLYISGGHSLRPSEALFEMWERKFANTGQPGVMLEALQTDTTTKLREIGERANANRITFYSLGVPDTVTSAELRGSAPAIDTETMNREQSLLLMTAPTGGLAALDPHDPAVLLGRMRHDFDHYYSLGYAPAERQRPGNHKTEVRMKRPGLRVRHREGYRDRTSQDRLSHQTMAALLFGAGDANPLGVAVRFEGEKPAQKRGQRLVSAVVSLPMSNVTLLPQGEVHSGRLTVLIGSRDGQGRTSEVSRIDLAFEVPNDQMPEVPKRDVGYRASLLMRPGPHTVVVGVRDELGNVDSTVVTPFGSAEQAGKAGR